MASGGAVAVASDSKGSLTFSGRGFAPLGYNPPIALTFEAWSADGEVVRALDKANKWIMGDWLAEGEDRFGEQAAQVIGDEFAWGFGYEKLKKLRYVASAVAPAQRRHEASWSHHMLVAPLSYKEQEEWLEFAILQKLSVADLKEALIAAGAIVPKKKEVPAPIVGDPVAYLTVAEETAETEEEEALDAEQAPDLPTTPMMMSDLPTNGTLPSQRNGGAEPNWDRDDYLLIEDDFEVKVPKDSPRKAARVLMNTLGDKWCASLIAELVALAPEDAYVTIDA